ncbi:MAG: hypothetical protein JWR26_4084, partial [Pedosphaera sp.]|nr:hypothetical protein [Pedosphaera sp.]
MSLFDNAIVTKRFRIGFGLLVFAVIGGIVWVVIGAHQPEYQGRDLKSWLYEAKSNDWMSARSETAIRAMGTDALPGLLAMVRVKDSLFRKGLLALSKKQEWIPINFRTREDIQEMAWHGILILGPIARPAIPDLVHDLDDPDPQVRVLAAYCLWEIGSPGQEAVPALIRCLNDALKRNTGSDWDVAQLTWTALALGEMGSASRQAIPQLTALSSLTNASDWFPALSAKAALIKINGESV